MQPFLNIGIDVILAFVIVRGAREKLAFAYPSFYLYLLNVLIVDIVRMYIHTIWPRSYAEVYWYTQFLSLVVGYCVIWECFSKSLKTYAGVVQMSRAIVSASLILLLAGFLKNVVVGPPWGHATTVMDLERNMRAIQAILLVALLGLVSYYAIPLGRNLGGIICGYGFFIGTRILALAVRSYLGESLQTTWTRIQPITYLVSLIIWGLTLWSYQLEPEPETEITIEEDYQAIAGRTLRSIARARHLIVRTMRA